MAYTDTGWIVIEGNGMSQMIGPQIVWRNRGGVFKEEMEAYMRNMELVLEG